MELTLTKFIHKILDYGKLVMFSHTIFSLSFALLSMLLAAEGLPRLETLFWIMICLLGARTGANAINRVIDAEIDAKNARTANRQIPRGEFKKKEVILFTAFCFLLMLVGAYQLNLICFLLSPVALFLMII
ncbi:MAG: 4-hydroxybenzoate octaprenyltransferase, partial [Herbinix sp.]|nr:4-hydroxybenzoate octaprenyltransferase [Herbinix sp.]